MKGLLHELMALPLPERLLLIEDFIIRSSDQSPLYVEQSEREDSKVCPSL